MALGRKARSAALASSPGMRSRPMRAWCESLASGSSVASTGTTAASPMMLSWSQQNALHSTVDSLALMRPTSAPMIFFRSASLLRDPRIRSPMATFGARLLP